MSWEQIEPPDYDHEPPDPNQMVLYGGTPEFQTWLEGVVAQTPGVSIVVNPDEVVEFELREPPDDDDATLVARSG